MLWNIMRCSYWKSPDILVGTYSLHLQGQIISKLETCMKQDIYLQLENLWSPRKQDATFEKVVLKIVL
jgi:hypothetical protein